MFNQTDFEVLQSQLLVLKNSNYVLEDKCKKLNNDNKQLKQQYDNLDKELQKANKLIGKAKISKDVEKLLNENEALQNKIQSQEEEFRLQNQTLMHELGDLVKLNEKYENELKLYKSDENIVESINDLKQQLINFKAENVALKATLKDAQDKLIDLEEKKSKLELYCNRLNSKRDTPIGSLSHEGNEDSNEQQTDRSNNDDERPIPLGSDLNADITTISSENNSIEQQSQLMNELNEIKLKLSIESEEKRLIKEDNETKYKELKSSYDLLKFDIENLNEKLNKKQELCKELQNNYDLKLNELNKLVSEKQLFAEKCSKYESHIALLESQIGSISAVNNQQLRETNEQYEVKSQQLNTQIVELMQEKENLIFQLEDAQKSYMNILEEVQKLGNERDNKVKTLDEMTKLADKRKQMIDEMAIKMQTDSVNYSNEIKQLKQTSDEKYKEYEVKIVELQEQIKELRMFVDKCTVQGQQISRLENEKDKLEKQLTELQNNYEQLKEESKLTIEKLENEHKVLIDEFEGEKQKLQSEYELRNGELIKQLSEVRTQCDKLAQEVKDEIDNKKLGEKKQLIVLKDLKRQLQIEKKRGDKLQEKLSELLSSTNDSRLNIDDYTQFADSLDKVSRRSASIISYNNGVNGNNGNGAGNGNGDTSSISSFSYMDSTIVSQNNKQASQNDPHSNNFDVEYKQLIDRVAQLQDVNWKLEEKVNHLETSCASMAEELMAKQSLIQYYLVDKKQVPATSVHQTSSNTNSNNTSNSLSSQISSGFKSFMTDIKNTKSILLNDNNSVEDVKKLRLLLEETLTKNMYLEQDMEKLTKELQKLKPK